MNPVGDRRRALWFVLVVLGISVIILCINLFVNPWWIALWRFVQSVVLFSLLVFIAIKWIIPNMIFQPPQEKAEKKEKVQQDDAVGQHVDLVVDDSQDRD